MVVLKKVKASSLNEVLVATIIIVVVFGIAMGILSNLLKNISVRDTYNQNSVVNELMYQYQSKKLKVPYYFNDGKYDIAVVKEENTGIDWISFEVRSKRTNKTLSKKLISNE